MNKKMFKIISLVLSFVLCVMCITVTAAAGATEFNVNVVGKAGSFATGAPTLTSVTFEGDTEVEADSVTVTNFSSGASSITVTTEDALVAGTYEVILRISGVLVKVTLVVSPGTDGA